MADPLSITLAVVTLATAVKDLVELAQKLERSFAKVSANFRDAERLAAEIRQTLEQLKDFCDEHQEILSNNARDMERSLIGLMKNMQSVYETSCGLISAPSERKFDKLKASLVAWKNRNRVESAIRELRNQVNEWKAGFMMFAVMRLEKRLVLSSLSSNNNAHELTTIRNEISSIRVCNERLVAFTGHTSGTPSTLPPEINVDYISNSYLHLQIQTINGLMMQLSSTMSFPVEAPVAAYWQPFRFVASDFTEPEDRVVLRQNVIARTLTIQSLLRDYSSSLSLQGGAWTMIKLAVGLSCLYMTKEAVVIGLWAVKLFRTLVTTNSTIYSPYLALSLNNLAMFHLAVNNADGARSAIDECLALVGGLQTPSHPLQLTLLLGRALTVSSSVSQLERNSVKSFENAEKAVVIFETLFSGRPDYEAQLHPIGEFELAQMSATFSGRSIYEYVLALQRLSYVLQNEGRPSDAVQASLRASDILTYLTPLCGTGRLELTQACNLYRLSHRQFRQFIPADRALPMVQQSVAIFRKHLGKDRQRHGRQLYDALWENGKLLGKMKRYEEALLIWKEAASLAMELVKDQLSLAHALQGVCGSLRQLNRYDEAVIFRTETFNIFGSVLRSASIPEGPAYYDLANDLQAAGCHLEAIQPAQMAVTQYRYLAYRDPGRYTRDLAKALTSLTTSLIHVDQKEQAFNEGHEAIKLYESLICHDASDVDDYIWSLHLNLLVAVVSNNEMKSIERGQDVISRSRKLVERFPPSAEETSILIMAIAYHSRILTNFDRLSEASVVIDEALDWYNKNPANCHETVHLLMYCLVISAGLLDEQGYTEKALAPIHKALEVGKSFSSNPRVASMVVASMRCRAEIFIEMGRYAEAVITCQEAVAFARETTLEDTIEFITCLAAMSTAYRYNKQTEVAIGTINEALGLCRGEALAELAQHSLDADYLLLLPDCLRILSQCLAAAGKESKALSVAQEAVDEARKLQSQTQYPTILRSTFEPIYMDALHNLSIRMAADSNLTLALELVVQCRKYYEQRAEARNSIFKTLACVLRVEGVFHCAAGHHEEGMAARAKLNDIQKCLRTVFPSLAGLVEIELEAHRSSPSWIALVAQLDLQCHHQDERPDVQVFSENDVEMN